MWGKLSSLGVVLFVCLFFSNFSWAMLSSGDLLTGSDKIQWEIQDPKVFNANTCTDYILKRSEYMMTRPFDFFVPKTEQEMKSFRDFAKDVSLRIFDIRIILKSKLTEFYQAQSLTPECTMAIRQAMRVARATEEMILVFQMRNKILPPTNTTKESNGTLLGDYPQTFKNRKFYGPNQDIELKSGDLIMMRGAAVVSALIARIGDEDGMFSHVGIFYKDPATQKKYIIESLIETGLKVTPYEEWMTIVEARVAVYRYPNETVGALAAQKLYDHFVEYKRTHKGNTVPYDFSMDLGSYDKMFCSEVASLAYDLASDGRIKLPLFPTSVAKIQDSKFLSQIGVKGSYLFSPNDLEIEPRFELVGEFRRIDRLLVLRTQDMAMQAMFDWMHNYGYKLKVSFFGTIKNKFGKILNDIGLKDFGIPKGMPAKTVQVMGMLRVLQKDVLTAHLDKYEEEFVAKTGQLPSHLDLLNELESFRKTDCLNFKNRKTVDAEVAFHQYFGPDNLTCE